MLREQSVSLDEGFKLCTTSKYSSLGKTYSYTGDDYEGLYWYLETDDYIIDIHDFFIKNERVVNSYDASLDDASLYSSYIVTGNGEAFNPYSSLSSNFVYFTSTKQKGSIFILHANFPYLSVGITFKKKLINDVLGDDKLEFVNMFFDTREEITSLLANISNDILNCKLEGAEAKKFFDNSARAWLRITGDAYLNQEKTKPLSIEDERAIEAVASYINDHYALDIPQEILESIASMSGTKLKKLFKQKYQMSITEYSQRKRMNIAETLLLSTNLEIKDIAKSVGYSSHSKFTNYYKKYKGMYPKDVKKLTSENDDKSLD